MYCRGEQCSPAFARLHEFAIIQTMSLSERDVVFLQSRNCAAPLQSLAVTGILRHTLQHEIHLHRSLKCVIITCNYHITIQAYIQYIPHLFYNILTLYRHKIAVDMLFVKPLANDDKHRLTSLYRLNSDVLVGGIKLKPLALSVLHKAFYTEYPSALAVAHKPAFRGNQAHSHCWLSFPYPRL